MAKNDVTGDALISKIGNKEAFDAGWDRIFGKKGDLVENVQRSELQETGQGRGHSEDADKQA